MKSSLYLSDEEEPIVESEPFPTLGASIQATKPVSQPAKPATAWGAAKLNVLQSSQPIKLPVAPKPVQQYVEHSSTPLDQTTKQSNHQIGSSPDVTHLILDSGAFISGAPLSIHGPDCVYLSLPSVVAELKDANAKAIYDNFPYSIKLRQPRQESLSFVRQFAQMTGDFHTLSATDLAVLALAYEVEVEVNGRANIIEKPTALSPELMKAILDSKSMNANAVDLHVQASSVHDAAADARAAPTQADLYNADQADQSGSESESEDEGEDLTAPDSPPAADDDSDGDWITPENAHVPHEIGGRKSKELPPVARTSVGCITTDYAMQNVLLQMGVRLLSVAGKSVSSIRQWLKKCHGCFALTRDMDREFCPSCGNHTLIRVTVVVTQNPDQSTTVRLFHGSRHLNKRGTRYSIPKPKGGRGGQGLRLAEDMMPSFSRRKNNKDSAAELFNAAVEFGTVAAKAKANSDDVFGYGRRNPNAGRQKTGNRRRDK